MALMRPDPTFYPSPGMAMQAPPERLAYVTLLNVNGNGKRDAMGVIDLDPQFLRVRQPGGPGGFSTRRQRAASLRLERVQRVPLPAGPARAHGAPLPHRAGHRIVADSHPRYEAGSQAAENREGDRAGRVHQQDRVHRAAHDSLRARRHLWERARWTDRRRPRRALPDGSRNLRAERSSGKKTAARSSWRTTSGGTWATTPSSPPNGARRTW